MTTYNISNDSGLNSMGWTVRRDGLVSRHCATRDVARAFVAACKLADTIPGAFVRDAMAEGRTRFVVVPPPVRIEAPSLPVESSGRALGIYHGMAERRASRPWGSVGRPAFMHADGSPRNHRGATLPPVARLGRPMARRTAISGMGLLALGCAPPGHLNNLLGTIMHETVAASRVARAELK